MAKRIEYCPLRLAHCLPSIEMYFNRETTRQTFLNPHCGPKHNAYFVRRGCLRDTFLTLLCFAAALIS